MDLANKIAEGDPAGSIRNQVGAWWRREIQSWVFAALIGIARENGTNDSGDLTHDVAGTGYTAGTTDLDGDAVIGGLATMGDQAGGLTVMGSHSRVINRLRALNQISVIRPSDNSLALEVYKGKRTLEDDNTPNGTNAIRKTNGADGASGIYTTFLFNPSAVEVALYAPERSTVVVRDEEAGNDTGMEQLITRWHAAIHVPGYSFIGTPAGDAPTKSELMTAANWNRTAEDRKQVQFARVVSREHA